VARAAGVLGQQGVRASAKIARGAPLAAMAISQGLKRNRTGPQSEILRLFGDSAVGGALVSREIDVRSEADSDLSEAEVDQLDLLGHRATGGPWSAQEHWTGERGLYVAVKGTPDYFYGIELVKLKASGGATLDDLKLIARLRNALPRMLVEIRRERRLRDNRSAIIEELGTDPEGLAAQIQMLANQLNDLRNAPKQSSTKVRPNE
jgi:hypothetical protein